MNNNLNTRAAVIDSIHAALTLHSTDLNGANKELHNALSFTGQAIENGTAEHWQDAYSVFTKCVEDNYSRYFPLYWMAIQGTTIEKTRIGLHDECVAIWSEGMRFICSLVRKEPHLYSGNYLHALDCLVGALNGAGREAEADSVYQNAIDTLKLLFQSNPDSISLRYWQSYISYGHFLVRTGRTAQAETILKDALKIFEKHVKADHNKFVEIYWANIKLLGELMWVDLDRRSEARELWTDFLDNLVSSHHSLTANHHGVLFEVFDKLASSFENEKLMAPATDIRMGAVDIFRQLKGSSDKLYKRYTISLDRLAQLLDKQQRYLESSNYWLEGKLATESLLQNGDTLYRNFLFGLKRALERSNRVDEAHTYLLEALGMLETVVGQNTNIRDIYYEVAYYVSHKLSNNGAADEAEKTLRKALDAFGSIDHANSKQFSYWYLTLVGKLGSSLSAQGFFIAAEETNRIALDYLEKFIPEGSSNHAGRYWQYLSPLAVSLESLNRLIESEDIWRKGIEFYQRAVLIDPMDSNAFVSMIRPLSDHLVRQERHTEAENLWRSALTIFESMLPNQCLHVYDSYSQVVGGLCKLIVRLSKSAEVENLFRKRNDHISAIKDQKPGLFSSIIIEDVQFLLDNGFLEKATARWDQFILSCKPSTNEDGNLVNVFVYTYNNYEAALERNGFHQQQVALIRQCRPFHERLSREKPDNYESHFFNVSMRLAEALIHLGEMEDAQAVFEELIEKYRELARLPDSADRKYQNALVSLAGILVRQNKLDEVFELFQSAFELFAYAFQSSKSKVIAEKFIAFLSQVPPKVFALNRLGFNFQIALGKVFSILEQLHELAPLNLESRLTKQVGRVWLSYTEFLYSEFRHNDAMLLDQRFLSLFKHLGWQKDEPVASGNFIRAAIASSNFAKILIERGLVNEALENLEHAIVLWRQSQYSNLNLAQLDQFSECLLTASECYAVFGLMQNARELCIEAIGLFTNSGFQSSQSWKPHLSFAMYCKENHPLSKWHANQAINLLKTFSGKANREIELALALSKRATLYFNNLNAREEAIADLRQSIEIMRRVPCDSPTLGNSLSRLSTYLYEYFVKIISSGWEQKQSLLFNLEGEKSLIEALPAIEEATSIYRAAYLLSGSDHHLTHLAHSLDQMASICANFTAIEGSRIYDHATEAVSIFNDLAERFPIQHEAELARCLSNYLSCIKESQSVKYFLYQQRGNNGIAMKYDRSPTSYEAECLRLSVLLTKTHVSNAVSWPELVLKHSLRLVNINEAFKVGDQSIYSNAGFFSKVLELFFQRLDQNFGFAPEADFECFLDFSYNYLTGLMRHDETKLIEVAQQLQSIHLMRWAQAAFQTDTTDNPLVSAIREYSEKAALLRIKWNSLEEAGNDQNEYALQVFKELADAKKDLDSAKAAFYLKYQELPQNQHFAVWSEHDFLTHLQPGEATLHFIVSRDKGCFEATGILYSRSKANYWRKFLKFNPAAARKLINSTELIILGKVFADLKLEAGRGSKRKGAIDLNSISLADHSDDIDDTSTSSIEEITSEFEKWIRTNLTPNLNGIERLTICTSDPLHGLPWQVNNAFSGLEVVLYPGIPFYVKAKRHDRHTSSISVSIDIQNELPFVVSVDACLNHCERHVDSETKRITSTIFYEPIHHVAIESALLQQLGRFEVAVDAAQINNAWGGKKLAYLHLACHGGHGHGSNATLMLGQEWGIGDILASKISAEFVFISACLAGKISDDKFSNAMGIAVAFLLGGSKVVISSTKEVPDHLMPILVGLVHFHAKFTFPEDPNKWFRAANFAKRQFHDASWPADFCDFIALPYAKSLMATLTKIESELRNSEENALSKARANWHQEILSKCKWIDEDSYEKLTHKISRTERSHWENLCGDWIVTALTSIQNNPSHLNRPFLREMALFLQVFGHTNA